jgi:hypothetical protein
LAAVEGDERAQPVAMVQPQQQENGGYQEAQAGGGERRHRLGDDASPRPCRAPDKRHAEQLCVDAPVWCAVHQ